MSLENLITVKTTTRGYFFDPWYSFFSGFFSDTFNYDSSRRHPYSCLPPLLCRSIKWIPLRCGVMDGYILDAYTNKPQSLSNLLWFKSSPFCDSTLIHMLSSFYPIYFINTSKPLIMLACYRLPCSWPSSLTSNLSFSCDIMDSQVCAVCGNPLHD